MQRLSIDIRDDGEKYFYPIDDNSFIEINHGEILKDLIYIDKKVFNQAYSELIQRIKYECIVNQVDMSTADETTLRLDAKLSYLLNQNTDDIDSVDFEEAFHLTGSILGYLIGDDIRAIIQDDHFGFLYELITYDLYNIGNYCKDISEFKNYLPELFNINKYQEKIKKLLVERICCHELEEYCLSGKLEMGFSIGDDSEIYYISSLDQFIRLEIRNIITHKSKTLNFCECEVCKRLFARGGSGSYKIVRCNYPYKIPCVKEKTEIDRYKDTIRNRINKHFARRRGLIDDDMGWSARAIKRIDQLHKEGKNLDEISEYMDNWWKTVKQYGKIKGIDWSQF